MNAPGYLGLSSRREPYSPSRGTEARTIGRFVLLTDRPCYLWTPRRSQAVNFDTETSFPSHSSICHNRIVDPVGRVSDGRSCSAARLLDPAYVAAKLMTGAGCRPRDFALHNDFENVLAKRIPVTQAGQKASNCDRNR
jgi:hypothetical protein